MLTHSRMSKHFHCFNQWSIKNLHVLICHIQSTPNLSFWMFLAFSVSTFFFLMMPGLVIEWRTEEKVMLENVNFLKRKTLFQWNPTSQVLIVISCDFTFWQSIGNFNSDVHFQGECFLSAHCWCESLLSAFVLMELVESAVLSYPPSPFDLSVADIKSTYLGFPGNSG